MKTEISKLPLKEWKHSLGVFLQMGRVQLDSDWNEQAELSLRLLQRQTNDVVRTGSPNHGFLVDDRILFDAMDDIHRWSVEKKNAGDPDPSIHVDYFDFKTGTGSLSVSGASAIVHTPSKARDLSQWKEVVFAAKGSFADNECTFFLGQGANRGLLTTTKDPGDIDGWRIFRADPATAAPGVDLKQIDSLGFVTEPAKSYQIDYIKIDSPIRQVLVNITSPTTFSTTVNPGDTAQVSINDSDRFGHSLVLQVNKVTAVSYTLPAVKDLSHTRRIIVSVGKTAAPAPSFNVTLTDANNQSVVLAGGVNADSGSWRTTTFPVTMGGPFDKTKLKSIQWGGLASGVEYHIAPVLIESDLENNLVIMGGDGTAGGAGRFYGDGLAAIKESHETYFSQIDLPEAAAVAFTSPAAGNKRMDLAYLDLWERPITYIEDPDIREIALEGPDTCTRTRLIAQVRLLKGTEVAAGDPNPAPVPTADFGNLPQFGKGVLTTKDKADAVVDPCADPCEPSISGTFLGEENRLFRVEIHQFGGIGATGDPNTAIFKWSRENGAVASALTVDAAGGDFSVIVEKPERYQVGDLIEISNDLADLVTGAYEDTATHRRHDRGEMRKISSISLPDRRISWQDSLSPEPQFHAPLVRPQLLAYHANIRRWDGLLAATAGDIVLADGVVIEFGGSDMLPGDYWVFATRVLDRSVERLIEQPPHGILHRYFPLAQISRNMVGVNQIVTVSDVRPHFDALTTLKATDIAYDPGQCAATDPTWAGVSNVQQALDALCTADLGNSIADHNKHLHGSGVVCGLQVHCNPDRNLVTVETGYALDCEGHIIRVTSPIFYELIKEANALNAIDNAGDGEVWLSMTRGANEAAILHLEEAITQTFWQKVLEGTLLEDFYKDCIQNLVTFFKNTFLPFPSTAIPVTDQEKLIISLINLFWQLLQPLSGQYVFISPAEHSQLQKFYQQLHDLLASKTFCAMFDTLTQFPAYPYTAPPAAMDTAFGLLHFHTRMRMHPAGKLVYTCGTGTKIDVYDVTTKALMASIDFPGGSNTDVKDVAFSNDGLTLYAVAVINGQDSVFASASINLGTLTHTWGPTHVVCDLQFVTLGTSTLPAHAGKLYAIGLAQGFYVLDPNAIPLTPVADVKFNATGLMKISDDNDIAIVAEDQFTPVGTVSPNFSRCSQIKLSAVGVPTVFYACSGHDFGNDIAVLGNTAYITADKPGPDTSMFRFAVANGAPQLPAVDLKTSVAVRLAPTLDKRWMLVTIDNEHKIERIDLTQNPPVVDPNFRIPTEVMPMQIIASAARNEVYVLNSISNTVSTVDMTAVFTGPPPYTVEPPITLSQYRTQMLKAFTDLLKVFGQYLKDCFCEHFLVDCPQCHREEKIYLGSIQIKKNPISGKPDVYKICNFTKRRYVKSEQLMEYWLSAIPIIPILKQTIAELCCKVI
ncbi:MAG TPA: DUF6519 domain-containing protein [Candidatus Angelobacter sp.]|jgi:hypothetical protein|nr:DUF6519 domain-containing protein [Candidatus Angelobacter sp.]